MTTRTTNWSPLIVGLLALWGGPAAGPLRAQTQAEPSVLCRSADPDISIAGCTALIKAGKDKGAALAKIYGLRGVAYMGLQDFDRAIQDFTDAIKLNPNDAAVFANRGATYGTRQEFDLAIRDFDRVVTLEPKATAYYDRASMYRLAGQNDRAIQDYAAAIALDGSFVDALLNRGITLAGAGRCGDALADLTRVVELNPPAVLANAYLNRALCQETLGHDDQALGDLSTHLRLEPRSTVALERRAGIFFRAGDREKALADFRQALIVNPLSARALYGQGVIRRLNGDLAGGNADMAQAAASRPDVAAEMALRGVKP